MRPLQELTDDEIDSLLLLLFNSDSQPSGLSKRQSSPQSIRDFSHEDLLRIRSRNHPDKWPNVNLEAYQAAVNELDRRRKAKEV